MKALVIGGAGFVGVAVSKELMRRGVETICASRRDRPYGTFTSHVVLDRRDEAALAATLESVQPDVLVDLACYQPGEVEAVMRTFRGARYIFMSTGVYPDLHGRPAAETDFVPLSGPVPTGDLEYREGKRWCETVIARATNFPSTVIRPPAILGAADHTLRVAAYVQRVQDGGPVLLPMETSRSQAGIAWVRDVGYATALAADLNRPIDGKAYNVAFAGVSVEDLVNAIGGALGRSVKIVRVPFADLPAGASPYGPDPARSAGYHLDRSLADLGFRPSALGDAVAEVLAWYLAEHPSHPGYEGRPEELALAAKVAV